MKTFNHCHCRQSTADKCGGYECLKAENDWRSAFLAAWQHAARENEIRLEELRRRVAEQELRVQRAQKQKKEAAQVLKMIINNMASVSYLPDPEEAVKLAAIEKENAEADKFLEEGLRQIDEEMQKLPIGKALQQEKEQIEANKALKKEIEEKKKQIRLECDALDSEIQQKIIAIVVGEDDIRKKEAELAAIELENQEWEAAERELAAAKNESLNENKKSSPVQEVDQSSETPTENMRLFKVPELPLWHRIVSDTGSEYTAVQEMLAKVKEKLAKSNQSIKRKRSSLDVSIKKSKKVVFADVEYSTNVEEKKTMKINKKPRYEKFKHDMKIEENFHKIPTLNEMKNLKPKSVSIRTPVTETRPLEKFKEYKLQKDLNTKGPSNQQIDPQKICTKTSADVPEKIPQKLTKINTIIDSEKKEIQKPRKIQILENIIIKEATSAPSGSAKQKEFEKQDKLYKPSVSKVPREKTTGLKETYETFNPSFHKRKLIESKETTKLSKKRKMPIPIQDSNDDVIVIGTQPNVGTLGPAIKPKSTAVAGTSFKSSIVPVQLESKSKSKPVQTPSDIRGVRMKISATGQPIELNSQPTDLSPTPLTIKTTGDYGSDIFNEEFFNRIIGDENSEENSVKHFNLSPDELQAINTPSSIKDYSKYFCEPDSLDT